MTLAMPDSINVAALPAGYGQYLGYADGNWPTTAELAHRFPAARRVILTVTGNTLDCDGIDCEPQNPNAQSSAAWTARKIAIVPGFRPVIYASTIGTPGYGMHDVLHELAAHGLTRSQVRLLSAHYGAGEHICGPATCNLISTPMDGTQWTDSYLPNVDMSALSDGFFGTVPAPTWTEKIVQQLPTLIQGATGYHVRTVQFECGQQGHPTAVDGIYGPNTSSAVAAVQHAHGLATDGIVGQQTWPVLLGIA